MPLEDGAGSCALVQHKNTLAALLERLTLQPAIALDTESNSFHAYRERICLIQIAIPGADYIIDPLAGLDLTPLGAILGNPAIEKVFHAAQQDVAGLKRDFGFRFAGLFDTMWAGRILGWPRVGLADLLWEYFGVRTSKRYQRYNWGERPLQPQALAYACTDVHYLLALRDRQGKALRDMGHAEEAAEVFDQLAQTPPATLPYGPQAFWHIKGIHTVRGRDRAVLWELYRWRDRVASRSDRPPFRVIADSTLVALARLHPRTLGALAGVRGMTPYLVQRYGRALLAAIRRGEDGQPPRPPRHPRPAQDVLDRYEALRTWRQHAASRRGVDADVILAGEVLWALARRDPATLEELEEIESLGPWRRRAYGPAILRVLETIQT